MFTSVAPPGYGRLGVVSTPVHVDRVTAGQYAELTSEISIEGEQLRERQEPFVCCAMFVLGHSQEGVHRDS